MNRSPLARSLLFVPGNQPQRVEKAMVSRARARRILSFGGG